MFVMRLFAATSTAPHAFASGTRRTTGEVEIEDELAVGRDERLVGAVGIEQWKRMLEPAAGAQDRGLVDETNARAEAAAVAELALEQLGAMMRVDDDVGDAVRDEVRDAVFHDRNAAHRQQRLGPFGAELAEPRRQPGT
jgi:hypothetical protein